MISSFGEKILMLLRRDTEQSWASCRESNAILLYLVDKYDNENEFGGRNEKEKASINQWLFFQASGQGYVLLLVGT